MLFSIILYLSRWEYFDIYSDERLLRRLKDRRTFLDLLMGFAYSWALRTMGCVACNANGHQKSSKWRFHRHLQRTTEKLWETPQRAQGKQGRRGKWILIHEPHRERLLSAGAICKMWELWDCFSDVPIAFQRARRTDLSPTLSTNTPYRTMLGICFFSPMLTLWTNVVH